MRRTRWNKNGFLLPMAIIFLLIATIVGLGILYTGTIENAASIKRLNREKAFYLADAGANLAYANFYASTSWVPSANPYSLGSGTFNLSESTTGNTVTFTSTGNISGFYGTSQQVVLTFNSSSYTTVPVKVYPGTVAVSPDNKYIYVMHFDSSDDTWGAGNSIEVVTLVGNTYTVTNTITLTNYTGPGSMVFNPPNNSTNPSSYTAYVTMRGTSSQTGNSGYVDIINTSTNTVTGSITVGDSPANLAISPTGSSVYVANYGAGTSNGTVSVISTATNTVTATITVGKGPLAVAANPNGNYVYVANTVDGTVSVISTATNKVVQTVTIGNGPNDLKITPNGNYVYTANAGSNSSSVINTATNTVTATIPVGSYPVAVNITPDGSYVYVGNFNSNNVSVISTATNTVTATIPVGTNPQDVGVTPNGNDIIVTDWNSSMLTVIGNAEGGGGTGVSFINWTKPGWSKTLK